MIWMLIMFGSVSIGLSVSLTANWTQFSKDPFWYSLVLLALPFALMHTILTFRAWHSELKLDHYEFLVDVLDARADSSVHNIAVPNWRG